MRRRWLCAAACGVVLALAAGQGWATPYFYFLNTNGGATFKGDIDVIDRADGTRSKALEGDDNPFGSIQSWRAFATDGVYYYVLNTNGSGDWLGKVERFNRDGTGRTEICDLSPGAYNNIGVWRGFATDGDYFYLLNTNGGEPWKGRIDRVNLDGTGRTEILDFSPGPLDEAQDWHGFATDGEYFYFLNTDGPGDERGQIDRVAMDGTGWTKLDDIEPSPFNNIQDWQGFAVDPVPEPGTLSLFALGVVAALGRLRRRRR